MNKVTKLIQELANLDKERIISFKNIKIDDILKNSKIIEILIDLNPFRGDLYLYAGDNRNKYLKGTLGIIPQLLVNKFRNYKITEKELSIEVSSLLKDVILKENIIIPDNIFFHFEVDGKESITLNNYNKDVPIMKLPYILREIKLKASDGTDLKNTKFGGKPNWIQNDETPKCPECKIKMSLVAQIDSFDDDYPKLKGNNRFMFSDVGKIYVFFPYCDCGSDPVSILQNY